MTVYAVFARWVCEGRGSGPTTPCATGCALATDATAVPLPRSLAPSRSRATTPCTPAPAGYDAGKKINGRRKRHIAVDSTGLPLVIVVTAASIQDRGGVLLLLAALRAGFSTAMTATMTQRLASTMTSSQTRSESKEVSLQDW